MPMVFEIKDKYSVMNKKVLNGLIKDEIGHISAKFINVDVLPTPNSDIKAVIWSFVMEDRVKKEKDLIAFEAGKMYFMAIMNTALKEKYGIKILSAISALYRGPDICISDKALDRLSEDNAYLRLKVNKKIGVSAEEKYFIDYVKKIFADHLKDGFNLHNSARIAWGMI